MTDEPPAHLIDWRGQDWTPECGRPAAHPNSRFTAPIRQCPTFDPEWDNPNGVPIKAFIFGGRMSKDVPLVFEAFNWSHGVYLLQRWGLKLRRRRRPTGHASRSHGNAAVLRIQHGRLLEPLVERRPSVIRATRVFRVNWFRRDEKGKFMWPGFGENMRVLKWIIDRVHGRGYGIESPMGFMPRLKTLIGKVWITGLRPSTN